MGENLEMSMVANIEGSDNSGASRYVGGSPNAATFTNGDAVGLAVGEGEFVKWVYNTTWKPEGASVNWNDKTSNHNFRAFYPYADNASKGSVPMPELAEQTGDMICVAKKDFLVASKTQTYGTNGEVLFTGDDAFKHVSSLVALTLKAEGELTFKDAIIVGLSQAVALIPGISRSGATIVSSLAIGMNRETAFKFSFFLYIPISLGGMVFSVTDLVNDPNLGQLILPYTLAFVASLVASYFSLRWFMDIMKKGKLGYFSIYCFIVGTLVIIFG